MGATIAPDPLGSASFRTMADHLTAPFQGGAAHDRIEIGSGGKVAVGPTREPLLLAAPAVSLAEVGLLLEVVLDPDGAADPLTSLTFAPWTEAGAFVPLHRPPADPRSGAAAGFAVALRLRELRPDGTRPALGIGDLRDRIELRLLQGVLGRLLYLLGSEKPRLRRGARELAAIRTLRGAHGDALDRHGADLGVTRFVERLAFRAGAVVTEAGRETDADYRRRLGIYRPLLVPTRRRLVELLNGPGGAQDPNAGPLAELGLAARFEVVEADDELAVAVKLVGAGASERTDFLEHVRATRLVWPLDAAKANAVHAARALPRAVAARDAATRRALRALFELEADAASDPALSRPLAMALVRAASCRTALGATGAWPLRRVQDSAHGSRYELGLGADLQPLKPAELDRLGAALADPARAPAADPEVEALLRSMTPVGAADDPDGRWLLGPCGLRTVHRVSTTTLYVSHVPVFGLVVEGPDDVTPGASADFEARYHAPGDPASHAVLVGALDAAERIWFAAHPPWTRLDRPAAVARWEQVPQRAAGAPALAAIRVAGLPALTDPASAVDRLERLPEELLATLALDAALAARIVAGDPGAGAELGEIARLLEAAGIASVLPLVTTAGEALLVAGAIALPEAGLNLAERRPTGFRWHALPLGSREDAGVVRAVGSRTVFEAPAQGGLSALVAIGYARRGATDPYELGVQLPAGRLLDLAQYELVMNLLEHACPLGVEVNSFQLRRRHVDLDGDGAADPLDPSAARTYRQFRRRRLRGAVAAPLED